MQKNRAFTLTELMIVIFIIVLLASLIIPTISKARSTAARTRCAAQLHDIGQMLQMYFGEHHNTLPKLNMMPSLQPPLNNYPSFVQLLAPYTHDGARVVAVCDHDTQRSVAAATMLGAEGHVSALRRERVGPFDLSNAVSLDFLEDLVHRGAASEGLLPVATALDDIPELAVTDQDAFSLRQGRPIVLLPRQVETLKSRLRDGSRTVSAFHGQTLVALGQLRAGRLEPDRVFNLL